MSPPPGLPSLPELPAGLAGMPGMPGMPPGLGAPPAPEPAKRLWAPSAQDLADLGVPPGIAVRMIRQNEILADEDNMPIIPYEGGPAPGEETEEMTRTGGGGD